MGTDIDTDDGHKDKIGLLDAIWISAVVSLIFYFCVWLAKYL